MRGDRDDDTRPFEKPSMVGNAGGGILRITLLFGSAAIALGLIVAPLAENRLARTPAAASLLGVDMMSTGSVGRSTTYTVRRSVLQRSPDAVCIIRQDGSRRGDCR